MKYSVVKERLQNLINYVPRQSELCRITNVKQSTMSNRAALNSDFTSDEIMKLNDFYNINLFTNTKNENKVAFAAKIDDVIKIPYWQGLPNELRHPEYTYVIAQRASIEQGWGLTPENLCITVMNGDTMENYWYKIRNNDVLIIDTNERKVNANGSGVYFATSRNNSMFWIREMQALYNGDIEFHSYSPSGVKSKILTQEQLIESDFKIIGKVIKNVSFRL